MATASRICFFQSLSSRTLELLCEEASAHRPSPLGRLEQLCADLLWDRQRLNPAVVSAFPERELPFWGSGPGAQPSAPLPWLRPGLSFALAGDSRADGGERLESRPEGLPRPQTCARGNPHGRPAGKDWRKAAMPLRGRRPLPARGTTRPIAVP